MPHKNEAKWRQAKYPRKKIRIVIIKRIKELGRRIDAQGKI